jgi:hypothetical protein
MMAFCVYFLSPALRPSPAWTNLRTVEAFQGCRVQGASELVIAGTEVLPQSLGRPTASRKSPAKPKLSTRTAASQQQLLIAKSYTVLDSCKLELLIYAIKKFL